MAEADNEMYTCSLQKQFTKALQASKVLHSVKTWHRTKATGDEVDIYD